MVFLIRQRKDRMHYEMVFLENSVLKVVDFVMVEHFIRAMFGTWGD